MHTSSDPRHRPRLLPPDERARFRWKAAPEDFEVEEVAVVPPAGEGEHLWLWVEKRGLSSDDALLALARALGVPARRAAYAGRKDVHALTRQWISFERGDEARARAWCERGDELADGAGRSLRVLAVLRHPRGLRLGASRGNHFRLVLRDVEDGGHERLARGLATLARRGAPAWFGAQRYGAGGRAHEAGLALLRGDGAAFAAALLERRDDGDPSDAAEYGRVREARELAARADFAGAARGFPASFALERAAARLLAGGVAREDIAARLPRRELAFLVSAAQSALFDRVLAARLEGLDRVEVGDVAYLHATRGSFVVEDAEVEGARAERFELSPTAPLPGRRVRPKANGRPRALEDAALAAAGLDDAAFERHLPSREGPWRVEGARRPLRWPLAGVELERVDATTARLAFELPAGAYATEVLAELGGSEASVSGSAARG